MFQYIVIGIIFVLALGYLTQVLIKTFFGGSQRCGACGCGGGNVSNKKGSRRKNQ